MSILVTIFYRQSGYNTDYTIASKVETHAEAESWIHAQLVAKGGTAGASINNVRVLIGEVSEEYTVERSWVFKPKTTNVKSPLATPSTGLEI